MIKQSNCRAIALLFVALSAGAGCGSEKAENSKVLNGPTEEQKSEQAKMEEFQKSKGAGPSR